MPSGFPSLDRVLGGGWPVGVLTELLTDTHGIGELGLLMPTLSLLAGTTGSRAEAAATGYETGRAVSPEKMDTGRSLIFIAPPYLPYAPALEGHRINISRLLVVHSDSEEDRLWAMEQALQSGTCAAVLAWSGIMNDRMLRRLQLAAGEGSCWTILFRPIRADRHASPAALRILLEPRADGKIGLYVFKNRGGRPESLIVET